MNGNRIAARLQKFLEERDRLAEEQDEAAEQWQAILNDREKLRRREEAVERRYGSLWARLEGLDRHAEVAVGMGKGEPARDDPK